MVATSESPDNLYEIQAEEVGREITTRALTNLPDGSDSQSSLRGVATRD